jgi:CRISPR-associated endonuclease/helicase Cas3
MGGNDFFAHISEDGRKHNLYDHLIATAKSAEEFASALNSAGWGWLAGLWHDLGKNSSDAQRYIRAGTGPDAHLEGKPGRVNHSRAGTV